MNLAESIRLAHSQNEARIAAEINTPKSQLCAEVLRHFDAFCKSHGVQGLPAKPATCALYVRSIHAMGMSPEVILGFLGTIEAVHSDHNLPNPIATNAVRTELGRILDTSAPRSWRKEEKLLFTTLPPEIKAVIRRRDLENSKELRRCQNELAALRKQIEQKGLTENGSPDQKTD